MSGLIGKLSWRGMLLIDWLSKSSNVFDEVDVILTWLFVIGADLIVYGVICMEMHFN